MVGDGETRTHPRRWMSPGVMVMLGALCLSCASPPSRVAPPIAPAGTPSSSAPPSPSSPAPSASVPVAALTGAAGRPLWTRDGTPTDRAVTAGDAVVALERPAPPSATLVPAPTGATPPPATPTPSGAATAPYRLVVLDAANGKARATHRLRGGDGRTAPPGPLTAKAYRGAPVAALTRPDPSASGSSIEEAYDPAGRRVWKSPRDGLRLFGDEGGYATADGYTKPPIGGPLTPIRQLLTLGGADIVTFGPATDEQVAFVHGGVAVVTRGSGFRVVTVARRPRTLWSSSRAAPDGFGRATPIFVLGDRLLVEWDDANSRHLLGLYDLATGRQRWRSASLPGAVTQGAVVADADSHIAVMGSDGAGPTLGVDVRTGRLAWRIASRQNVRPVAGARGRVYGMSGDTALAIDARTGRTTTLGTHVEIVGLTADGVLVLHGATGPISGRIWALRPPATGP